MHSDIITKKLEICNKKGLKNYVIILAEKRARLKFISPANFTPEEVEAYKYSLAGDNEATPKMVKKWLKKTGGINGQAFYGRFSNI